MHPQLKIEHRDPVTLDRHFHPSLKSIPELEETSPEFLAIAAGVGRLAITEPLKVDGQGRILDDHSRILLRCALRWQFKSVPVVVMADVNAPLLIISGIAHRRHLSKSAIAYLAAPLLADAFEIARQKMRKNIEISGVSSGDSCPKTVEELAEELGVDRNTLFEARKVHNEFADKKLYTFQHEGGTRDGQVVECTLKQWFEPKLLQAFVGGEHESSRPLGLGGIVSGIKTKKENPERFSPKSANQLELFTKAIGDSIIRWKFWTKFSENDRAKHLTAVREKIAKLEPQECESAAEYYSKLAAEFRKSAKAPSGAATK